MKILILSDLHRNLTALAGVLMRRRNLDDLIIFLGDGCADFEDMTSDILCPKLIVSGNGETYFGGLSRWEDEAVVNLDGFRIMAMHGHRYGVKEGLDAAIKHASVSGADILLYGHTHIPYEEHIPEKNGVKALHIFNPGSIGAPVEGYPSFGTLEIKNGEILFGHGNYRTDA